jgi:glycosyltransferase involved in cell wall biosynthesis
MTKTAFAQSTPSYAGAAPIRTLHCSVGNLYGGIETALTTFSRLRSFVPELETTFAVCFPGKLRDELRQSQSKVFDLVPVRYRYPWSILKLRRRLKEVITAYQPHVMITHGSWIHGLVGPVAIQAKVQLVRWIHGITPQQSWLDRYANRFRSDLVIANSQHTLNIASTQTSAVRFEKFYFPVQAQEHTLGERQQVRGALGASDDTTVILQASRLESWKGHRNLILALAELKHRPDWVYWMAGGCQKESETEYLNSLKVLATECGILDRIVFLGDRSDISKVMNAADVLCQPNLSPEPFGIVFIEALYAGLPIISTNFGGAAEIVDESCGLLTAPESRSSLVDALNHLLGVSNLRDRYFKSSQRRAFELCDPAHQMAQYGELIASVVQPGTKNGLGT